MNRLTKIAQDDGFKISFYSCGGPTFTGTMEDLLQFTDTITKTAATFTLEEVVKDIEKAQANFQKNFDKERPDTMVASILAGGIETCNMLKAKLK